MGWPRHFDFLPWNPAKRDAPRYTCGVLAKYAAHVTSASLGAVTDMDLRL
jgi:hypothetical protein